MGFSSIFKKKPKAPEPSALGSMLPMPAFGRVILTTGSEGVNIGVDWTATLPQNVMQKIFEEVCPHTTDESYESCEASAVEGEEACMLCDMRDLSNCVRVCKRWRKMGVPVLYRSIRIDAVHYCEREEVLSIRRKKKKFLSSKKDADIDEDTSLVRMKLLCRTLRDDTLGLGNCILLLKTPYMTRETCKSDLARICAVAPNLRYADFPEGFFSAENSCSTLRNEVEIRCPDMRKMCYRSGAEKAIENIATGSTWPNLEVLELSGLSMDPATLRYVFGALERLQALKVGNMQVFGDVIFAPSSQLPLFPPIKELILEDCPNVTVRGLLGYLANPAVAHQLDTLNLQGTGVQPWDLYLLLSAARNLRHLSLIEVVSTPFPVHQNTPQLQNPSLVTLHYEIEPAPAAHYTAGTQAYHSYLTTSLLMNGLPNLKQVFVRDVSFAESLVEFVPPMPGFMADSSPPPFKPSGTNGDRFSTASQLSNWGGHGRGDSVYGSPPSNADAFSPSMTGGRGRGSFSGGSPHQSGSFLPTSSSPPQFGAGPRSPPANSNSIAENPQRRAPRNQAPQGLKQPLDVYTKGLDEMEWNFSTVQPSKAAGRKGSMSATRPISAFGIDASGGRMSGTWSGGSGGGFRKSVVVGNGFGGFLALPEPEDAKAFKPQVSPAMGGKVGKEEVDEWPAPPSLASKTGNRRESKYDIWR